MAEGTAPDTADNGALSKTTKSMAFTEQIVADLCEFLSADELVALESVGGEFSTTHSSERWKHLPLQLPRNVDYAELETVLQSVPNVHTIYSEKPQIYSDILLSLFIKYLKDLRVLDVKFIPPITPAQLQDLLNAFPNLESVRIHANDPQLRKLFEISSCSNMKEVKFYTCGDSVGLNRVTMICNILANRFPKLQVLDIQQFQIAESKDSIFNLLSRRLDQIEFLKLTINENTTADMLNMIFNSPFLQQLSLTLLDGSPIPPDMRRMVSLKSLCLNCEKGINAFMISHLEFPKNVEKLIIRFYNPHNKIYHTGISEKVVSNLHNLKYLELLYLPDEEIVLQGLENLRQLHTLILFGPRYISEESMISMARSQSLKNFAISGVELPSEMYHCLKACMSLRSLAFCSCVINLDKTLKVANKLNDFEKLYLLHCFDTKGYPDRRKIDRQLFDEFVKVLNNNLHTTVIAKRDLPLCLKSSSMHNRKVEDYIFANFRLIDFCFS